MAPRILWTVALLITVSGALPGSVVAQESGEAKVFRSQFLDLAGKVRVFQSKIGERTPKGADALAAGEENLAFTKLAHRLGEEAAKSSIESQSSSKKVLLLVSQGCEAISFTLMGLDNLVTTRDRAFLGLARDGQALVQSTEKLL